MLTRIFSLLLGTGILLVGAGFLFTLLGVRAGMEGFSNKTVGVIMSSYFLGFVIGSYVCPLIIRRAGHVRAFAAMASIASTMAICHVLIVGPLSWSLMRVVTVILVALGAWPDPAHRRCRNRAPHGLRSDGHEFDRRAGNGSAQRAGTPAAARALAACRAFAVPTSC